MTGWGEPWRRCATFVGSVPSGHGPDERSRLWPAASTAGAPRCPPIPLTLFRGRFRFPIR